MNPLAIFTSALVCSLIVGSWARAADSRPSPVAAALMPFIDKKEITGAVTIVATPDKVLALDVIGKADLAGDAPMKPDTIFWIASMTKPITGAAIMILQDEHKLAIDDPIGKYIPELAHLKTADGVEHVVTLRHILTHTSGMADITPEQSKTAKTLAELVPFFAKQALRFEPGSKWEYSQSGINTAGRIVEIASGKNLAEFFQERFFTPLGMKDTTFYPTAEQAARIAKGYALEHGELVEHQNFILYGHKPDWHDHFPAANGGLYSTAADYTRFLQMLLNHGELDGKRYLSTDAVKQMTSVQSGEVTTGFTPGNGWGIGACIVRHPQGVTEVLSPGSFGHGGAWGTQAWADPVKGRIYVLMVQRANFPNSDASDVRAAFQKAAAELKE